MIIIVFLFSFAWSLHPANGQEFSTYDQFRQAVTSNFPEANPTWDQFNKFNQYARSTGGITDKQEAAMALAQFLHESWGLRLKRECVPGTWPCVPCDNSNSQCHYPQSCDVPGKQYFGRGYIHLTWSCDNYRPASIALYGDESVLLNDPDRVSDNDDVSWQTTFWYWRTRVHDAPGVQQGRFGASTNAINGPKECGPNPENPTGAETRYNYYKNVRRAWRLPGDGDASGCR